MLPTGTNSGRGRCGDPCVSADGTGGKGEEDHSGHSKVNPLDLHLRSSAAELKSTDYSPKDSEFNSQQPHGGSQPSVMGPDAILVCLKTVILYSQI